MFTDGADARAPGGARGARRLARPADQERDRRRPGARRGAGRAAGRRRAVSCAEAQTAGLIDRLSYWDEVVELAEQQAGPRQRADRARRLCAGDPGGARRGAGGRPGAWYRPDRGRRERLRAGRRLGHGRRHRGRGVAAAIDDPEVEAILFRIDSGGGSAVASETIGHEVRRAVEQGKPVIVSMGDVAASGGYWIAMDATRIVAERRHADRLDRRVRRQAGAARALGGAGRRLGPRRSAAPTPTCGAR